MESARDGRSEVLVLRGEAGVGKTELLEYVALSASGCRIARAAGVESEMELPYAGLHQLCAPLLGHLDGLPAPQRDALCAAFGLGGTEAPERFVVSLGVLGLLSAAAEERPLVCLVDDAQWLDRLSVQVLAFVARRLQAEAVGLVFTVRAQTSDHGLLGLPEVILEGLDDHDATTLLRSAVVGPIDDLVLARIVAETRGNPLALLEIPRGLSPAELSGGFVLPTSGPLAGQIENSFLRRIRALPADTRRVLLVAAADPVGDLGLLTRAVGQLGVDLGAARPAEAEGLIEMAARLRFRHPLVRSATYRAATLQERLEAHRTLGEATDGAVDPDRRAWHLSCAALGPDEEIASELERSAGRARSRGGAAAAAAFLERAAALTVDPVRRSTRALAAAEAKHQAGELDAAVDLVASAEAGPLDDHARARATLVRGQITFASSGPSAAVPLFLDAARRLDPVLAHATYRDAFAAAMFAGRLAPGSIAKVAAAARRAPPPPGSGRSVDLAVEAAATLIIDGYTEGAPLLTQALRAFRDEPTGQDALPWFPLMCRLAHDAWDLECWDVLSSRFVELAREAGALSVLPIALLSRTANRLFAGEFTGAARMIEEAERFASATGRRDVAPYGTVVLNAWRGDEAAVTQVVDQNGDLMVQRGEGQWLTATEWSLAVLYNGLGRYDEAFAAAEQAAAEHDELGLSAWASVELVEAAARSGRQGRAIEAVDRFTEVARSCGTSWASGSLACARALVAGGDEAEPSYLEAIAHLEEAGAGAMLARSRLLYGEWLRREQRRVDARAQLRIASESLDDMGAAAFAERAHRELVATGETARKRRNDTRQDLTGQEAQIGQLAADGHTNSEIGTLLYISPRTVEWHLRKIYSKLGISSRRELRRALPPSRP